MDQVSRPLLITLLATVVLAAGWMAFMRPAAVETATEEVTAPAQVATQAAEAAKATDARSAATEAAADAATADPAATQAPAAKTEAPVAKAKKAATPVPADEKVEPKATEADPQAKLLAQMDSGKVVVLLFWDRTGADDRAARDAARDVNRRDGKVVVRMVDVRDVGRYDSVTQGVTVAQSPTTMVIAPDGTARVIAGLSESTEVDQLVRAALPRR